MAKAYSLDDSTAANGGAFKLYVHAYDRVSDKVYQEVFSMEVGHVSEPFSQCFRMGISEGHR